MSSLHLYICLCVCISGTCLSVCLFVCPSAGLRVFYVCVSAHHILLNMYLIHFFLDTLSESVMGKPFQQKPVFQIIILTLWCQSTYMWLFFFVQSAVSTTYTGWAVGSTVAILSIERSLHWRERSITVSYPLAVSCPSLYWVVLLCSSMCYHEVCVDSGQAFKQRSSGVLVYTGTGSTSW